VVTAVSEERRAFGRLRRQSLHSLDEINRRKVQEEREPLGDCNVSNRGSAGIVAVLFQ